MKILSNIEAGSVEFNVVDPFSKGRSLGVLLSFNDKTNRIFPQIVSNEDSISKMLTALENELLDIIQNRFKGRYNDIDEYNKSNPSATIPIRVLDIYEFPQGFNSRSYSCLCDIILHSQGTGVIVNLHCNVNCNSQDKVDYFTILNSFSKRYTFKGNCFTNSNDLPLIMPKLPSDVRVFKFAEDYMAHISEDNKPKADITFRSVAGEMFAGKSASRLLLPLGLDNEGNIQKIVLGSDLSHHMLITGATGSGKSSLLHAIIIESLYNYSPEEVNLYLLDFKSGIEFKMYDRSDLPDIKLLAVDAMQEFGESILVDLCNEIDRRAQLFKRAGVESLSKYTQTTGSVLPRILIIIDEFQTLFDEHNNRAIAVKCADYADNIVIKGRSFGIHLIMSTQTLKVMNESISLRRTTIDQMRSRIGLHCSEEDCRGMFGQKAEEAYSLMAGPVGTAVYMKDDLSNPERFTVAYSDDKDRAAILDEIAERSKGFKSNIQVFEGSKEYTLPDKFVITTDSNIKILIGHPISVLPDISVSFKFNYSGNTFVASNDEALGKQLERILLRGLCEVPDIKVYFIRTGIGEYVQESDHPKILKALSDKDAVSVLYRLSCEMDSRKDSSIRTPIFLFISNLQWNRLLQNLLSEERVMIPDYLPDMEELNYNDANLSDRFASLLRNGSAYNIFTIVTTSNCEQIFQGIRRSLVNFNNIIGAGLNERELEIIFGYGYHLMPNLALYSDRSNDPKLFKVFKN